MKYPYLSIKHTRFTKHLLKKVSGIDVAAMFGKKKIYNQFPISVSPARAVS